MEILNSHMGAEDYDDSDENEQDQAGDKSMNRRRSSTVFSKKISLKSNKLMKKNTG